MVTHILLALLMLIGIFLLWLGIAQLYKSAIVKRWPTVPAEILSKRFRHKKTPGYYGQLTVYYPEVTYAYNVLGHRYEQSTISADQKSAEALDESFVRDMLGRILEQPVAYYNPRDPSIAILLPTPSKKRSSQFIVLIVTGIFLIATVIVFLFFLLR